MRSPQKRPMRSAQTEPTRSLETEPTRSPETDPMRSPQTGARACALQPPPLKLDADGQALRERLCAFRTQAMKKITKSQRALPRLSRSPLEY